MKAEEARVAEHNFVIHNPYLQDIRLDLHGLSAKQAREPTALLHSIAPVASLRRAPRVFCAAG